VVFLYYYYSNVNLLWEIRGICRYFLSQYKYIQDHWLNKTRWRMSRNRIFSLPKCRKKTCETLKKLVHKINFHHWTCLYKTLNVVFVYYYSSYLNFEWETGGICWYFLSQYKYIQNHWFNKTLWRMTWNHIFSSPKCRKWTLWNTQEISKWISLSSLDMFIHDLKCCIRELLI